MHPANIRTVSYTHLDVYKRQIYLLHYQLIPAVLRFSKAFHVGNGFDAYFALQFLMYVPILLL